MTRRTSQDGRWPVSRPTSAGLGYDDPARIRRWPRASRPRPPQRTACLCAVNLAKKISEVESS